MEFADGPFYISRLFQLTEGGNRINLTNFGYLLTGTELGTEFFSSVNLVLVPVNSVLFSVNFAQGYHQEEVVDCG
jgi:hypothetical protein